MIVVEIEVEVLFIVFVLKTFTLFLSLVYFFLSPLIPWCVSCSYTIYFHHQFLPPCLSLLSSSTISSSFLLGVQSVLLSFSRSSPHDPSQSLLHFSSLLRVPTVISSYPFSLPSDSLEVLLVASKRKEKGEGGKEDNRNNGREQATKGKRRVMIE